MIDLKNTRANTGFDPRVVAVGRDLLKDLRAAPRNDDYRIVLDVKQRLQPKGFTLNPVAPYGHRLVVDLYGGTTGARQGVVPKPDGRRDIIIAIDAGHGGEDPGALGPNRVKEKIVVLQIAERLRRKFAAAQGYEPVMVVLDTEVTTDGPALSPRDLCFELNLAKRKRELEIEIEE